MTTTTQTCFQELDEPPHIFGIICTLILAVHYFTNQLLLLLLFIYFLLKVKSILVNILLINRKLYYASLQLLLSQLCNFRRCLNPSKNLAKLIDKHFLKSQYFLSGVFWGMACIYKHYKLNLKNEKNSKYILSVFSFLCPALCVVRNYSSFVVLVGSSFTFL